MTQITVLNIVCPQSAVHTGRRPEPPRIADSFVSPKDIGVGEVASSRKISNMTCINHQYAFGMARGTDPCNALTQPSAGDMLP